MLRHEDKSPEREIQVNSGSLDRFDEPTAGPVRGEESKAAVAVERELVGMPRNVIGSTMSSNLAHVAFNPDDRTGSTPVTRRASWGHRPSGSTPATPVVWGCGVGLSPSFLGASPFGLDPSHPGLVFKTQGWPGSCRIGRCCPPGEKAQPRRTCTRTTDHDPHAGTSGANRPAASVQAAVSLGS